MSCLQSTTVRTRAYLRGAQPPPSRPRVTTWTARLPVPPLLKVAKPEEQQMVGTCVDRRKMMGWTTTAFLVLAAEASGLLIVPQAGAKSEEEKRKEESNRQLDNAARDRANPQDERNRNRPSESSDVTFGFKWDLDSRGRLSNGRACLGRGSNMTCTDDVRRKLRPEGDK